MAALIGRKDVMEYTKESFISSAYWTDKLGPAAALATLKKHRELNVGSALAVTGDSIQKGWQSAAENTGLKIQIGGIPQMTNFLFDRDVLVSQTLFTQEMLARGFLANNVFFPTYAHKSDDVDEYLEAVEESFEVIAVAQATGEPKKFLRGPVRSPNFARLD